MKKEIKAVKKPKTLEEFERQFPEVWKAYSRLRDSCDHAGTLDSKTRELIKIGIETASHRRGGLIAHIHRAKALGAKKEEIMEAIMLAIPLVGFPLVLDAFLMAKAAFKEK